MKTQVSVNLTRWKTIKAEDVIHESVDHLQKPVLGVEEAQGMSAPLEDVYYGNVLEIRLPIVLLKIPLVETIQEIQETQETQETQEIQETQEDDVVELTVQQFHVVELKYQGFEIHNTSVILDVWKWNLGLLEEVIVQRDIINMKFKDDFTENDHFRQRIGYLGIKIIQHIIILITFVLKMLIVRFQPIVLLNMEVQLVSINLISIMDKHMILKTAFVVTISLNR